ncbi:hypothetical protein RYX36_006823 [Vicia faba]
MTIALRMRVSFVDIDTKIVIGIDLQELTKAGNVGLLTLVNEQKVRNGLFGGQRIILRFPSSVKASKPLKCDLTPARGSLTSAKLNLPIDIPDEPQTEVDLNLSAKLYTALRMLRQAFCREAGDSVYGHHIFSNTTLQQISKKIPRTKEELLDINGIGKVKINNYGDRLLETIENTIYEYYNPDKNSSGSKGSSDSAKRRREANKDPDSNAEDDEVLIKSTGPSKKRTDTTGERRKIGKTVREAHEKLKVGSVDVLHCYYAHGEENENFQRRSYWMLETDMMHTVFVHYLDVKINKTNISARSADSMSPTSTLTSLCEEADSEDIHKASPRFHTFHESQNLGNGPLMGPNFLPLVQGGKSNPSDTTYIEGRGALNIISWDNGMEKSAGLYVDPSPVSSNSIPSSSISNFLEQEHDVFTEGRASQSFQSNWLIPFEDNTGEFPKWSFTQSLTSEFESDYSAELLGKETNNASPEIGLDPFYFNYEPKEQPVQQNMSNEHAQSQDALKSDF